MKSICCAHGACECQVEPRAKFCSASCESAAASDGGDCACGHGACRTADRSLDGVQGEGNREADRH
jgi:hypothetical protein